MDVVPTSDILKTVEEVEKLGDSIISDRHSIVDMDRIRNKNGEALSALRRPNDRMKAEEHVWMNIGDLFFRTTSENLISILDTDQRRLDEEIKKTRDGLKPKVNQMQQALGKPEVQGFNLKPLSDEDLASIYQPLEPFT